MEDKSLGNIYSVGVESNNRTTGTQAQTKPAFRRIGNYQMLPALLIQRFPP